MKQRVEMIVEAVEKIALDTVEMKLSNDHVAKNAVPGQFLHLQVEGHSLRRPISIADVDAEKGITTILFKELGEGTKRLGAYQPGMRINALGPSGCGFPYQDKSIQKALLIGGGIGVPPLYNLGKELSNHGIEVISVLGFQTKDSVFYEAEFSQLGETHIVTDDGSYGHKGFVTNVLGSIDGYDYYFTCGPIPMLKAVKEKLADKPGYISLEERMGCGVGACFACVIPADNESGYRKICKDGPVFPANEVIL
ncbi:dihydroorotate dehydrogenase electron transfer subunit [Virgibacillus kekensis]|uniref:Dihydroorotate dehydrogenase B (NAD(+)), electron transfer subunit n=1 Tax=Virgibacillus kekensis TaxID=202261 RepID=A0ABV9DE07_9BACI